MRAKSLIAVTWVASVALLIAGCAGCSSSMWEMQEYRPPALTSAQGAVLTGSNGVYVMEIDHQSVRTRAGVSSGVGGNEVLLTPGTHRIHVERAVADPLTSLEYSLSSKATFQHTFAPGHTYNVGYTIGFEMTDQTTGQTIQPLP